MMRLKLGVLLTMLVYGESFFAAQPPVQSRLSRFVGFVKSSIVLRHYKASEQIQQWIDSQVEPHYQEPANIREWLDEHVTQFFDVKYYTVKGKTSPYIQPRVTTFSDLLDDATLSSEEILQDLSNESKE